MDFCAPYNFVPLVDNNDPLIKRGLGVIVCPEWGPLVNHDVPFKDGLSGWLDLEIKAHTPIFIRGTDNDHPDQHYKTPDGDWGIPGTSLRGMLRNVVEIATFSRMNFITERRFGVRDLQNPRLYTGHMTETVSNKSKTYAPKVEAGWLDISEETWTITPCDHWRVEISGEKTKADNLEASLEIEFGGVEVKVSRRYSQIGEWASKDIWFTGESKPTEHKHSRGNKLVYKKVTQLSTTRQPEFKKGRIVLTGRPNKHKHMDFIFESPSEVDKTNAFEVPKDKQQDFELIHSDGSEQHRTTPKPNDALAYYKDQFSKDQPIPVFYLKEGNVLKSFGLAQMFKLSYKYSPKELYEEYLRKADPLAANKGKIRYHDDFAELIFGRVENIAGNGVDALRGRITIETAISKNATEHQRTIRTVLGSPKASYYPSYVRQYLNSNGTLKNRDYKTYMDTDARIAGWKRYQQRSGQPEPPIPEAGQQNVATSFRPLETGATFKTRMFFHNLKPQELGALLWAVDFGGSQNARHGLGMAKPLGFGAVTISVKDKKIRSNHPEYEEIDEQKSLKSFVDYMNERFSGEWETSEQILDLIALATPGGGRDEDTLRYMEISNEQGSNEFVDAKKANLGLPGPRSPDEVENIEKPRCERLNSKVPEVKEHRKEEKSRLNDLAAASPRKQKFLPQQKSQKQEIDKKNDKNPTQISYKRPDNFDEKLWAKLKPEEQNRVIDMFAMEMYKVHSQPFIQQYKSDSSSALAKKAILESFRLIIKNKTDFKWISEKLGVDVHPKEEPNPEPKEAQIPELEEALATLAKCETKRQINKKVVRKHFSKVAQSLLNEKEKETLAKAIHQRCIELGEPDAIKKMIDLKPYLPSVFPK